MKNNLKELRLKKGFRQIDVATKLGFISPDRISHWEKGVAMPSVRNLFRLAKLYEVRPEELYFELFETA